MDVAAPSRTEDQDGTAGQARDGGVAAQLARLRSLTAQELRTEWRRIYRAQPPRISPDLMIRALAYRLQEMTHGGLSKATQRRLKALAKMIQDNDPMALGAQPQVRPGARLVREWRGVAHTVTVLEDGFEYRGQTYTSLTRIAREITGAHWSGPRFFGLVTSLSARSGIARRNAEAGDG